jgi:hypothetical protein
MNKITICHCGEDGYYSCVELREQLQVARKQLEEAISEERAAVVAWLEELSASSLHHDPVEELLYASRSIERGEHRKES